MPDFKFTFDPVKVKITDGEILADLTYPARPGAAARTRTREGRRRSRIKR